MEWHDVFANPGEQADVEFVVPGWVGRLNRRTLPEADGASTAGNEVLSLATEEMGPNMSAAWATSDGWPAMCTRFTELADVLGGKMVFESYEGRDKDNFPTGEDRHCVTYKGRKVEDL